MTTTTSTSDLDKDKKTDDVAKVVKTDESEKSVADDAKITTSSEARLSRMPDPAILGHRRPTDEKFFGELIRIITGLFIGTLALMTFLLTVGYQHPHKFFEWSLYLSISLFAVNIVAYIFGHLFRTQSDARQWDLATAPADDKVQLKEFKDSLKAAKMRLRTMRVFQIIFFILAVAAVTCLAIAAAHFFFAITTTSAATGASQ